MWWIKIFIGQELRFLPTPLHSMLPLGEGASEYCHNVWHGKTRIVWLPNGYKIRRYVTFTFTESVETNKHRLFVQTDGQTPHDGRPRLCTALRGKNDGPHRQEANHLHTVIKFIRHNTASWPFTGTLKEQRNDVHQYGDWLVCYISYSEEGPGRAAAPPRPLLAVPNVTAHPSTASVPTSYHSMWHYNCLCTLKS